MRQARLRLRVAEDGPEPSSEADIQLSSALVYPKRGASGRIGWARRREATSDGQDEGGGSYQGGRAERHGDSRSNGKRQRGDLEDPRTRDSRGGYVYLAGGYESRGGPRLL